jgi:GNAT superfamily N-acetyltransferase
VSPPVTTVHLEMLDPAALRPARDPGPSFAARRALAVCPELNRFFYVTVGAEWSWKDRLPWSLDAWRTWLDRPEVETWIGYLQDTPAGYVEIEAQAGGSVEIVYFGLLPSFLGRGLGGALLTAAVRRAWARGAMRVWVHTCSLDHPAALANYRARGFTEFKRETAPA